MRVLVFCDSLHRFTEFAAAFKGSRHKLYFVCCSTASSDSTGRFYLSQVYHALRAKPASMPKLLIFWAARRLLVTHRAISSDTVRRFLNQVKPDLALHALGVIYRADIIEACGLGILNAHIGELPTYRGRSVMEWTLVSGGQPGVTVFFIDEGIDTGARIVLFEAATLAGRRTLDEAKRHLFSQDSRVYRKAVDLIEGGTIFRLNTTAAGTRFYEMSALFRQVLSDNWLDVV